MQDFHVAPTSIRDDVPDIPARKYGFALASVWGLALLGIQHVCWMIWGPMDPSIYREWHLMLTMPIPVFVVGFYRIPSRDTFDGFRPRSHDWADHFLWRHRLTVVAIAAVQVLHHLEWLAAADGPVPVASYTLRLWTVGFIVAGMLVDWVRRHN